MRNRARLRHSAIAVSFAVLIALLAAAPALLPTVALAEEMLEAAQSSFSYTHNPIYNPRAMRDVVVNPDAVYGFSPNPDAGSISGYAAYDWTDPAFVAQA